MTIVTNLGFSRMGVQRELKKALESYWQGKSEASALLSTARELRARHWRLQRALGVQVVPCNDFSLYDHMLDMVQLLGCVPPRYAALLQPKEAKGALGEKLKDPLVAYFAQARGFQHNEGVDVKAMEMTKWFDTNYHYIVPELSANQKFSLHSEKVVAEFREAVEVVGSSSAVRPVVVGPITFLLLSKLSGDGGTSAPAPANFSLLSLLPKLLPVYSQLLAALAAAGATWVQLDEPALVTDDGHAPATLAALQSAYATLRGEAPAGLQLLVATYFGEAAVDALAALPVHALHVDVTRTTPAALRALVDALKPKAHVLSLGIVDGRNVWKADLTAALAAARQAHSALGASRLWLAPSCSLLHVPVDLALETKLDAELRDWLAFAADKLSECAVLAKALDAGEAAVVSALAANSRALASRRTSARIHVPAVHTRLAQLLGAQAGAAAADDASFRRAPYPQRAAAQKPVLQLPLLPTTTIGSFPQTDELRNVRARYKAGKLAEADYAAFVRSAVAQAVHAQERMGLDVLVHGEFERNDMVEFFGEQLDGFAFTANAWVQSYGSRCVKPPIIFGDVRRPRAMTVEMSRFAQAQTPRPVKAMLTGPVTLAEWSFVRDDMPRVATCRQLAAALRDEVQELQAAGLKIIQIDEAALAEGSPLRERDRAAYYAWAAECFRMCTSGARPETQIHTHMCYCEFDAVVLHAIMAMDVDVISLETSRSQLQLLGALQQLPGGYAREMGPGMYDIHSPRIPSVDEMAALLRTLLKQALPAERLWVNPDCGLKTRTWEQVEAALKNMVAAAKLVRAELKATPMVG